MAERPAMLPGGGSSYAIVKSRKPMPYRCRDCRQYFSVRKGTVMLASGLQKRSPS